MRIVMWVRALLQRRRAQRELEEEMAFHLEMETAARIARGMPPDAARRTALAAFGGVVQTRERVRDVRVLTVESIWQDVTYAARSLSANPRFTAIAVGMLALAIGLTTAMFTLVDALVLRPVPFRDPEQLAQLWMRSDRGGSMLVSPAVVRAWRASPAFVAVESAMTQTVLVESGESIATAGMAIVTPGLFELLGDVKPIRGRLFDTADVRSAGSPVLISASLWSTLFGADPDILGRSITIDRTARTVIGVLPADFRFPAADTVLWTATDLQSSDGEQAHAYIRFASNLPRDEALRLATAAARDTGGVNAALRAAADPMAGVDDAYSTRAVPLLAGGVGLVFAVLAANVCGLLLARMTSRRREFSMRAALGASRGRLMRQAMVESAVFGALGCACGAAVAWVLVSIAEGVVPEPMLRRTLNTLDLDARALGVTSAAGVLATLAIGVLPAWLGTRVHAGDALRVVERGGTESRGARRLGRGLLVAEVALACTLLVGATLLLRTFVNLTNVERGVATSSVSTMWISLLGVANTSDPDVRLTLAREIEDSLRGLPGVRQVAWSYGVPPGGGMSDYGDWIPDGPGLTPVNVGVDRYLVSPEFFAVYDIPIIRGRGFGATDSRMDVVVSEQLARALWPGADPLGRTFRFMKESFQVIGVARETVLPAVDHRLERPEFYIRYAQMPPVPMVSLRCDPICPEAAVLRHRLTATHPTVDVQRAQLAEAPYERQLALPRASAALAGTFAILAIVAAAGGLFSVLSYTVTRRRREIGIRTALGATRKQIRSVVLREGAWIAGAGLVIGSVLGAWLAHALTTLQYGVTPGDLMTWVTMVVVIAGTCLAASWLPARMAARLDPLALLRED